MADRIDAATISRSNVSRFAQVMERIGLAILGALCGLFVAALVAKANIEEINSLGVLLSAVLRGSIEFYLGTNIPSLSAGASGRTVSDTGSDPKANPIALASATGTFLAAVAALVSVYMIIFDETPPFTWNMGSLSGGCSAFCCNSPLVQRRGLDSTQALLVNTGGL
jgi:hypothetical protein